MSSNDERVSVIVPIRDERHELPGLLAALAAQTLRPREIVFVDDGSRDGSAVWLAAHLPDGARLLRSNGAGSSYGARNIGVRAARGRWLAFTDADCRPAPDWLEHGAHALESEVRVAGRIVVGGSEPSWIEELDARRFLRQERFVRESFAATANLFVRRRVFDEVGLFDERLVSSGDQEFGARARAVGVPIHYADRAVVHHPARRDVFALVAKAHRVGFGFGQMLRHHPGRANACSRAIDRASLMRESWRLPDRTAGRRCALVAGHAVLAAVTALGCAQAYWFLPQVRR